MAQASCSSNVICWFVPWNLQQVSPQVAINAADEQQQQLPTQIIVIVVFFTDGHAGNLFSTKRRRSPRLDLCVACTGSLIHAWFSLSLHLRSIIFSILLLTCFLFYLSAGERSSSNFAISQSHSHFRTEVCCSLSSDESDLMIREHDQCLIFPTSFCRERKATPGPSVLFSFLATINNTQQLQKKKNEEKK